MKLASLRSQKADGRFVLVHRSMTKAADVPSDLATSLLQALEKWDQIVPQLQDLNLQMHQGTLPCFDVKETDFMSCLPRTYLFADGSSFLHHVRLVRKARNAEMPDSFLKVPLIYQGESGRFLDPMQAIPAFPSDYGTDFEAEVGVITTHVPMGITAEKALEHIALIVLINDVSLRGLIPQELSAGFGFFQSKPASALSPVAVTIDELGPAWKQGRVHLPLNVKFNENFFGKANAGKMHFHFGEIIAHAAKTRDLQAGTLIGSGTVSNDDPSVGSSCLVEKRTLEQLQDGMIQTPYMKVSDQVEIWMENEKGESLFGRIFQKVASE